MSLRIAILGCGKQARKHLAGLKKCAGVEPLLADAVPERAESLARELDLAWVEAPEEVYSDPGIAAVAICTPTRTHAAQIRRALAAHKDFFCEKPLCETAEEAREIREHSERSDRIGMVGQIYRFAPVFGRAREILAGVREEGRCPALGRVTAALFRIGGRGSHAAWKHQRESGGGAVNEMLVHMLDLAVWYLGPLERTEVLAQDILRPRRLIDWKPVDADAEDFVIVRSETASGIPVFLQADLITPAFAQMMEIQGENGSFFGSIQASMPQYVHTLAEAGGFPAGRTDLPAREVNMFDQQMAAFVEAIRTRQRKDQGSLEDSVHVMEAMEAVRFQLRTASPRRHETPGKTLEA